MGFGKTLDPHLKGLSRRQSPFRQGVNTGLGPEMHLASIGERFKNGGAKIGKDEGFPEGDIIWLKTRIGKRFEVNRLAFARQAQPVLQRLWARMHVQRPA